MKTLILGLAFTLALPVAAHAEEVAKNAKADCCCCKKDESGKMACCDKMKKDEPAKGDPHAGHDQHDMK